MIGNLHVENFKSLEKLDLDISRMNVFVGPNNAGKSNIVDSLLFLRQLVTEGAPAVNSRGGFRSIVFDGQLNREILIRLKGEITVSRKEQTPFKYEMGISGGPNYFSITKEHFATLTSADRETRLLEFQPKNGMCEFFDEEGSLITRMGTGTQQLYLRQGSYIERLKGSVLSEFAQEIESWKFLNAVPSRMKGAMQARKELSLDKEGQNLAAVIHSLHSEYDDRFETLEDHIKKAVPEIKSLQTPLTEQGETYISIAETGLTTRIPSWAMSDGTLRLLGILTMTCSPVPTALFCLEEPENCIHPGLLEYVVDIIRSVSKKAQIIATTHSPYLVNFLAPEDLVITEKKDGRTECKRASETKDLKKALQKIGLGELWYSGAVGGVP